MSQLEDRDVATETTSVDTILNINNELDENNENVVQILLLAVMGECYRLAMEIYLQTLCPIDSSSDNEVCYRLTLFFFTANDVGLFAVMNRFKAQSQKA